METSTMKTSAVEAAAVTSATMSSAADFCHNAAGDGLRDRH
jgi:Rad3-related DNA helicase